MDEGKPEFPRRFYTKGEEPLPLKSIGYYSNDTKLFAELEKALEKDEWDEIYKSPLGVFLQFNRLNFEWASRLVHHMLTFQIVCNKKYEIWSLVNYNPLRFSLNEFEAITGLNCEDVESLEQPEVEVTDEMEEFWEKLGVNFESGPSIEQLIAACKNSNGWDRIDRVRLGYLAIYAGFIEARKPSTPTRLNMARLVMDLDAFLDYPWGRVAFKNLILSIKEKDFNKQSYTLDGFVEPLQIWVYEAMPDFAKLIGEPLPGNPSPPLLAYRGSRGRKNVKENILKQTNFRHYKTIGGMISPVWQDDESDDKVDNIMRAFNGDFGPWKWGRGLWETVGIYQSNNPKVKIEEKGSSKRAGEFDEPSGKRHCPGHSTDMGDIGVNILESLKDELGMWGGALLDQMREGFNSCDLRFDMLTEKIEGLASDLDKMKGDVTGTKQADPLAKGKKDSPASAGTEEDASNEQKKDVAVTGTKEAVSKEKNDSKSDMVSSEHLQFPTTIPHKHNTRYKAKKKLDFQKD